MKAVAITHYLPIEHPDSLLDVDLPKPVPTGRDILVAIKAIAVNPVDTKVRAPKEAVESSPKVLGWDACGVVEAVGDEVTLFTVGDEVYYAGDITCQGSNAEYQLVDERIVGRKPTTLSYTEAAALPLTTITAYETLFDRFAIDVNGANTNETLLIIGGAGGVGSVAIQLAKLAGLNVIATASRPASIAWVKELGADCVIDHTQALPPQVEQSDYPVVDYIAIFNNTDAHWQAASEIIRPQGAIATIVENKQPLDQQLLKVKSVSLSWEFMFTRSMFATPDMQEQHHLLNQVADLIDDGKIKTTVSQVMRPINADNIKKAHAALEQGHTMGKIVLEANDD